MVTVDSIRYKMFRNYTCLTGIIKIIALRIIGMLLILTLINLFMLGK